MDNEIDSDSEFEESPSDKENKNEKSPSQTNTSKSNKDSQEIRNKENVGDENVSNFSIRDSETDEEWLNDERQDDTLVYNGELGIPHLNIGVIEHKNINELIPNNDDLQERDDRIVIEEQNINPRTEATEQISNTICAENEGNVVTLTPNVLTDNINQEKDLEMLSLAWAGEKHKSFFINYPT